MIIRMAELGDLPRITEIYNQAVVSTTATFDEEPVSLEERRRWLEQHDQDHPVVVLLAESGELMGWGALSPFGGKSAYRYTVEHSIYVDERYYRRGVGKSLLFELMRLARILGYHSLIGRITADNEGSLILHKRFGFEEVGRLKEVGFKFDRWLDVVYVQKRLTS